MDNELPKYNTASAEAPFSLSARLEAATDELIRARTTLFNHTEAEILAREVLKAEEAMLLLSGEIVGKNETERTAQLRAKTAELRKTLADAEADVRGARFWLETCQDKLRLLRDLLRIEELDREGLTSSQGIE